MEKETKTIRLKSSIEVARELKMSRQGIDWVFKHDERFPEPFAIVNRYKGWTDEQIEQYKKDSGWYEKQEKKEGDPDDRDKE